MARTQTPHQGEPPNALEAERAVLGSLLLDQDVLSEVGAIVEPDDFYLPLHRTIFGAMLDLSNNNCPIEIVSLHDRLKKDAGYLEAGGGVYLAGLEQYVVTSAQAPAHANTIAEKSRLRKLAKLLRKQLAEIETEEPDSLEATRGLIQNLTQIIDHHGAGGWRRFREISVEVIGQLQQLHEGTLTSRGLPTHYADLDGLTGGFHRGELVIIAARPSVGKSALACNILFQMAKGGTIRNSPPGNGVPGALFSIEMKDEENVCRMMAALAEVNGFMLRMGKVSKHELLKVHDMTDQNKLIPLYIDDRAGATPGYIRQQVLRLKNKEPNLAVMFVDYLQLMRADRGRNQIKFESRQQEVAFISSSLKSIARDFDICVVALSQLSRLIEQRGKNAKPQLSDLKESGAIEQDADAVMFLHRPEEPDPKKPTVEIDLIIGKQRNGPIGVVPLVFDYTCFTFLPGMRELGEEE